MVRQTKASAVSDWLLCRVRRKRERERTKGDDADGLKKAIVYSHQFQRELAAVRGRNAKALGYDGEDDDHHARQGKCACFGQLYLLAGSRLPLSAKSLVRGQREDGL